MGCDIHIVIQVQDSGGAWREQPWQEAPYEWEKDQPAVPDVPIAPNIFRQRNYDLFGLLADVRNGHGFAGIQTGEGWPSIAPNRGLPDGLAVDAVLPNPKYPEDGPRSLGDHSFTWVTLDELQAFPWDHISTRLYGVVPAKEYERLKATKQPPQSYSGGTTGPGIQTYDADAWDAMHAAGGVAVAIAPKPYVRMHWTETAREATGNWPGQVLPWLDELAAGRPLRLVLGFDS